MACILTNIRLSRDERIDVIPYDEGISGEINIYRSEKGEQHLFVITEFLDEKTNKEAKRILFGYSKKFLGLTPKQFQEMIGKPITGEFLTKEDFITFIWETGNKAQIEKILSAKAWLTTFDTEYRFADHSPSPKNYGLNSKFDFGQYRGLTLREVMDIDEKYISQCFVKPSNFYIDDANLAELRSYKSSFDLSPEAYEAKFGTEMWMDSEFEVETEEDYEKETYEALCGEDYENFDGDWDSFYASKGMD